MKFPILFILAFLCLYNFTFAQDWQFFPPGKTYYFLSSYRNMYEINESILYIRVDSVVQKGDTLLHGINQKIKIHKDTTNCTWGKLIKDKSSAYHLYDGFGMSGRTPFIYFQKYVGNRMYWGDRDTTDYFLLNAQPGMKWDKGSSKANCLFVKYESVFGIMDSIKYLTVTYGQNTDTFLLSKNNGLLLMGNLQRIDYLPLAGSQLNPIPQVGDLYLWDYYFAWPMGDNQSHEAIDSVTAVKRTPEGYTITYDRIKNYFQNVKQPELLRNQTLFISYDLQAYLQTYSGNYWKAGRDNIVSKIIFSRNFKWNELTGNVANIVGYYYSNPDYECNVRSAVANGSRLTQYVENIGLVGDYQTRMDYTDHQKLLGTRRGKQVYGKIKPFIFTGRKESTPLANLQVFWQADQNCLQINGFEQYYPLAYRITDPLGKIWLPEQPLNATQIALDQLPAGLWIVQILSDEASMYYKFIKY